LEENKYDKINKSLTEKGINFLKDRAKKIIETLGME